MVRPSRTFWIAWLLEPGVVAAAQRREVIVLCDEDAEGDVGQCEQFGHLKHDADFLELKRLDSVQTAANSTRFKCHNTMHAETKIIYIIPVTLLYLGFLLRFPHTHKVMMLSVMTRCRFIVSLSIRSVAFSSKSCVAKSSFSFSNPRSSPIVWNNKSKNYNCCKSLIAMYNSS